jgi:hypothetical protein
MLYCGVIKSTYLENDHRESQTATGRWAIWSGRPKGLINSFSIILTIATSSQSKHSFISFLPLKHILNIQCTCSRFIWDQVVGPFELCTGFSLQKTIENLLEHHVILWIILLLRDFENRSRSSCPTKHHGFPNVQSCNLDGAYACSVQTFSSLLSHSGSYQKPPSDGATTAPALGPYS